MNEHTEATNGGESQEAKFDLQAFRKEFALLRHYAAFRAAEEDKIGIQKIYVDVTGDIKAALVLDELIFWTLPRENAISGLRVWKDGVLWLAVGRTEWWERKRLTPRQADRAVDRLVQQGLVIKKIYKFNSAPTVHLRLNIRAFFEKYTQKLNILHPPEAEDTPLEKDLADLYEMMEFSSISPNGEIEPNSPNGNLPIGKANLPNGEIFNNPHTSLTSEEEDKPSFAAAWLFFQNNIYPNPTPFDAQLFDDLVDEHSAKWVIEAMKIAVERNARSIKYFRRVLERWKREGYGTPFPAKSGYKPKESPPSPKIPIVKAPESEPPVIPLEKLQAARKELLGEK